MRDLLLVPVVLELEGAPGVHLVSNLVDVVPEDVRIDMPVEVGFFDITGGWKLHLFRPAASPVATTG